VSEALKPFRNQVVIAIKLGFLGAMRVRGEDSRPERISEVAEAVLKRLRSDRIALVA
jgi:aryl-alcohol dehydrogenase-like predicted oxidoreductase